MVSIMWNALIRVNNDPVGADRAVLRRLADEWSNELLPRYRRLVASAQERVESATPDELVGIVDEVGTTAGEYLFSLAIVGGLGLEDGGRPGQVLPPAPRGPGGLRPPGAAARPAGRGGGDAAARRAERRLVPSHPRRARPRGRGPRRDARAARDRGRAGSGRSGVPRRPRRPAKASRPVRRPAGGGPDGTPRSASSRRATSPWDGRCCAAARSGWARGSPKAGRSTIPRTSSSSPAPSSTSTKT